MAGAGPSDTPPPVRKSSLRALTTTGGKSPVGDGAAGVSRPHSGRRVSYPAHDTTVHEAAAAPAAAYPLTPAEELARRMRAAMALEEAEAPYVDEISSGSGSDGAGSDGSESPGEGSTRRRRDWRAARAGSLIPDDALLRRTVPALEHAALQKQLAAAATEGAALREELRFAKQAAEKGAAREANLAALLGQIRAEAAAMERRLRDAEEGVGEPRGIHKFNLEKGLELQRRTLLRKHKATVVALRRRHEGYEARAMEAEDATLRPPPPAVALAGQRPPDHLLQDPFRKQQLEAERAYQSSSDSLSLTLYDYLEVCNCASFLLFVLCGGDGCLHFCSCPFTTCEAVRDHTRRPAGAQDEHRVCQRQLRDAEGHR